MLRGSCLCGGVRYEITGPLSGALDDDPGVKPKFHVFVATKAPWFEIADELPQFPELPKKAP